MAKTPLKSKVNRFFYRNQNKGIPNLMLYIAVGNAVVYLMYLLNRSNPLFYNLLCFDYERILHGQVWRLFSYPLVFLVESTPFLGIVSLLFYYWVGTVLDQYWGALRFNCYYLCGIVLTDLAGMLVGLAVSLEMPDAVPMLRTLIGSGYLNMSLLLAVATVLPDQLVRIWFVIPVKMKWLAWLDVGLTVFGILRFIFSMLGLPVPVSFYLVTLIPLVAIVNYLLFFGKQAAAILPDFIRYRPKRKSWKREVKQGRIYNAPRPTDDARFRCTVCGRTERTNPRLEFRYCSKCAGYRCYCQDHINNHTHILQ